MNDNGPDPEPTTKAGRTMLDGDLGGLPPRDLWRKHIVAIEDEAHADALDDAKPVIEAAFAVVEDMRSGLNKSHPRAAKHLAAYDAVIAARRAALDAAQEDGA